MDLIFIIILINNDINHCFNNLNKALIKYYKYLPKTIKIMNNKYIIISSK